MNVVGCSVLHSYFTVARNKLKGNTASFLFLLFIKLIVIVSLNAGFNRDPEITQMVKKLEQKRADTPQKKQKIASEQPSPASSPAAQSNPLADAIQLEFEALDPETIASSIESLVLSEAELLANEYPLSQTAYEQNAAQVQEIRSTLGRFYAQINGSSASASSASSSSSSSSPSPSAGDSPYTGFICTHSTATSPAAGGTKLVAVDCEMVRTSTGLTLGRLTLVDGDRKTLFDEFVRPAENVLDYCTQWSGLTKDLLDTATHTFEQAQQAFLTHVTRFL